VRENEKEVADLLAQGFQRYGVSTKTLFLQAENHGVMDFVREGAGRA
jgi:hypothetical protein